MVEKESDGMTWDATTIASQVEDISLVDSFIAVEKCAPTTWDELCLIRSPAFGMFLDVEMNGIKNGTVVNLWDRNLTEAQRWTFDRHSGMIRTPLSGKFLDAAHYNSIDWIKLQIWEKNDSYSQIWEVQRDGTIIHLATGKLLTAKRDSSRVYPTLLKSNVTLELAQQWQIIPLSILRSNRQYYKFEEEAFKRFSPSEPFYIRNVALAKVLELFSEGAESNVRIHLSEQKPDSNKSQIWTIDMKKGLIQNPTSGKMLHVWDDDDSRLHASNDSNSMKWVITLDGTIIDDATRKALTATSDNKLYLRKVKVQDPKQQWQLLPLSIIT